MIAQAAIRMYDDWAIIFVLVLCDILVWRLYPPPKLAASATKFAITPSRVILWVVGSGAAIASFYRSGLSAANGVAILSALTIVANSFRIERSRRDLGAL